MFSRIRIKGGRGLKLDVRLEPQGEGALFATAKPWILGAAWAPDLVRW